MMATSARSQPPAAPRTRYEDDLYTWVEEQVALLRSGQLGAIDAENIAEELGDVGRSEYYRLQSAISVLSQHLLKWDHQPKRRSRSWMATVNTQRAHIEHVLADNPGLKSRLEEAVRRGYRLGRDQAVAETDIDYASFPEVCHYSFEEMMTRRIAYEPAAKRAKR